MKKELGSLFSYDEYQNLTDMVSGSSQSAGKYNSNNLLEEVMDSEGNVVTYSYSRGNLETIKSQHSITCNNVYSDDNQITCQVIESETTYDRNEAVYDEYGNIIKSKDALNNITRYSYDSANFNRLCKIEGVKVILELEYNTKNRILSKMFKDIDNHNNNCKIKYVYEDDLIKNVYVDSVLKYTFVYNETKSIQEVYLAGTLIYKIDYNTDDEIEYVSYGNSILCDPWGTVLARGGAGEEILLAEADFARNESVRRQLPIRSARREELYQ